MPYPPMSVKVDSTLAFENGSCGVLYRFAMSDRISSSVDGCINKCIVAARWLRFGIGRLQYIVGLLAG